jgi:Amt family ammonium transporter
VLGASLLWFGWFGFNAGSRAQRGGLAANAFVVTNTAAAMAALTWMTVSWLHKGAPSVLGRPPGAVAGLVAITPASGLRRRLRRDPHRPRRWHLLLLRDPVHEAVQGRRRARCIRRARHRRDVGRAGDRHLRDGRRELSRQGRTRIRQPGQLGVQAIAVLASVTYAAVMTFVILKLIDVFIGLRVPESEEVLGLDASQHREAAYTI